MANGLVILVQSEIQSVKAELFFPGYCVHFDVDYA
jgi:hypothetical protein